MLAKTVVVIKSSTLFARFGALLNKIESLENKQEVRMRDAASRRVFIVAIRIKYGSPR